jgi:hypothetical protein
MERGHRVAAGVEAMTEPKGDRLAGCYQPWDGKLRKYTEWGCAPMLYLDAKDNVLCPECAQEALEDVTDNPDDIPVMADINYEDPSLYCDECSERIESAYAEDEVGKPTDDE